MSRTARAILAILPALIVSAALLALSDAGRAQSSGGSTEYLVEVLVVEPIPARSDDWPSDEPERAGPALDPRLTAELRERIAGRWRPIAATGLPLSPPLSPRTGRLPSDDDAPMPAPDQVVAVTRPPLFVALDPLPDSLASLRDRVARSPDFDSITASAWLQPSGSPRRPWPVRLHDEVIVDRVRIADAQARPNDPGTGRPIDARAIPAGRFPARPADRDEPRRPSPARAIYRLDGTVALVRRQFLHAELDLFWQTPIERLGDRGSPAATGRSGDIDGWRIHRLQQSRVIRPDRWEYFDSERFGVLIRVTELEPLLPLPPPEPPAPQQSGPSEVVPASPPSGPPAAGGTLR